MKKRWVIGWFFGIFIIAFVWGCEKSRTSAGPPSEAVAVVNPQDGVVLPEGTLQVIAVGSGSGSEAKLKVDGKPYQYLRNPIAESWRTVSQSDDPASSSGSNVGEGKFVMFGQGLLLPGEHVIEFGSERLRVYAKGSGDGGNAPADWPVFRIHPPPKEPGKPLCCANCHSTSKGATGRILGGPGVPEVCYKCHEEEEMELVHMHRMESIATCQMCQCHEEEEMELVHMHRMESIATCQMCHEVHGSTEFKALKDDPKVLCTECHE